MRLYLKSLSIFIILGFLATNTSCSEEEKEPIIEDEFLSFITSFIEEGNKRGVELSIQELEASLVTEFNRTSRDGVCGYGWFEEQLVEILSTDDCWHSRTHIEKENLMYHELGHALLGRQHINQTLPNQATQKSIMCTRVCSNFEVFYEDGPMREYYLDELFNENSPFPDSIANKQFKERVYEEEFQEDNGDYLIINFDGTQHSDNYQIQWDSTASESSMTYGLGIHSTKSEKDSVIVFRSFELLDFKPYSNIKAKANFISEDFDGEIAFRITLQDGLNNPTLRGISFAQRRFVNVDVNNELEIELYSIPPVADWVTISFFINSNDVSKILLDKVEVELLE